MSSTEPRCLLGWLVRAPSLPVQDLELSSPGSCPPLGSPPGCKKDRTLDSTTALSAINQGPFTLFLACIHHADGFGASEIKAESIEISRRLFSGQRLRLILHLTTPAHAHWPSEGEAAL